MKKIHLQIPYRLLSLLATTLFLVQAAAYGQQAGPGAVPPIPGNGAQQSQFDVLRTQIENLTHTVESQQETIERQTVDYEQLREDLGQVQSQVRRLPPVASGGRMRLASDALLDDELIPEPYVEDGYYDDKPVYGDCECDGLRVDIGGQYRVVFDAANFDFHLLPPPQVATDSQETQNVFLQRFRTWFEMHTNENVSVYFQLEMGHILWGNDNLDFPKTYDQLLLGDRAGVELRRGYMTYKDQCGGVYRVGIQDWHDAFGESYTLGTSGAVDDYDSFGAVLANSIWDFNVGGISYTREFANLNVNLGAFSLYEGDVHGADDAYLLALDVVRPTSEDHSVGVSAYFLSDNGTYSYPTAVPYDSASDMWLGIRGSTALASIPLRAFAIYNSGNRKELGVAPDYSHDNVALKLEVPGVPLWVGDLSFQTLYSTAGFRTIAQSAPDGFGAQGYWSYLLLTSPHGPSDVNDLGVSLQNRGLGLFTVQGKYDYPITCRLSGTFAAGWFNSATANPVSGSSDMGTELAKMFSLDLSGGLTVDLGAAVLFTGDFYRDSPVGPSPDTLWEVFTRVQLEF
jgi:hypothetical protein